MHVHCTSTCQCPLRMWTNERERDGVAWRERKMNTLNMREKENVSESRNETKRSHGSHDQDGRRTTSMMLMMLIYDIK